jgi:hypothetical protein
VTLWFKDKIEVKLAFTDVTFEAEIELTGSALAIVSCSIII